MPDRRERELLIRSVGAGLVGAAIESNLKITLFARTSPAGLSPAG